MPVRNAATSCKSNGMQDSDYEAAGATLVSQKEAFGADLVLKVRPPKIGAETDLFNPGSRCIFMVLLQGPFCGCFLAPDVRLFCTMIVARLCCSLQ